MVAIEYRLVARPGEAVVDDDVAPVACQGHIQPADGVRPAGDGADGVTGALQGQHGAFPRRRRGLVRDRVGVAGGLDGHNADRRLKVRHLQVPRPSAPPQQEHRRDEDHRHHGQHLLERES